MLKTYKGRALYRDVCRHSVELGLTLGALLGILCGLFI